MEHVTVCEKSSSKQRPRFDRFIPPRDSLPDLEKRLLWSVKSDEPKIWYNKLQKHGAYMRHLENAFGLTRKRPSEEHALRAWPCAPRKKTYLTSADSILDLPTYSHATFPELLDWSSNNHLVAALGNSYHKWSWQSQSLISQGFANSEIQVCKFDPWGEILALGTVANRVEIHNSERSKCVACRRCECGLIRDQFCLVTTLDWSPTGRSFATGCSRGVVVSYSRNLKTISRLLLSRNPILSVRISPNTRYVAVAAVNESEVFVLTWPILQKYTSLDSNLLVKTLTWHPWSSALLGIGATRIQSSSLETLAHVAVWDIPTGRVIKKDLDRTDHILDAMLFSRRTGELVVSLSTIMAPSTTYSDLVVLNSRFSVVDHWGEGRTDLDRVRTMIFSPDGTKLATATSGEDLIIWNFLPEDRKRKESRIRKFSAIPVYLDFVTDGTSVR